MATGCPVSPHSGLNIRRLGFWPDWPHLGHSGESKKGLASVHQVWFCACGVAGKGKKTSPSPGSHGVGGCVEAAADQGRGFRGSAAPREGGSSWGSRPCLYPLSLILLLVLLLSSPTARLSYTRTPTRRSSCLSECQVSSQDPPGLAQLEVLAVTEPGVAVFQTLYEVSWEDMNSSQKGC